MNVFLSETCWPCLFIVLANVVIITKGLDHRSGSEVNYFSGEFENFLHGLGSMVYKYKKPTRPTSGKDGVSNGRSADYLETTVPPTRAYRRSEKMYRTQKEVLKDVLMMKLVSYYEDKYKIMHTDNQEPLLVTTPVPVVAKSYSTYAEYDELPRSRAYEGSPKNFERRNGGTRTSPQTRRQFRNTIMHRDMAEVIVI